MDEGANKIKEVENTSWARLFIYYILELVIQDPVNNVQTKVVKKGLQWTNTQVGTMVKISKSI